MFFAFILLLLGNTGLGVLAWLGWRRLAAHLRSNPEAVRALIDHVLAPLFLGQSPAEKEKPAPESAPTPETKKAKGTLI